jgi:hypothetical protein
MATVGDAPGASVMGVQMKYISLITVRIERQTCSHIANALQLTFQNSALMLVGAP